jgi:hypothetical protein
VKSEQEKKKKVQGLEVMYMSFEQLRTLLQNIEEELKSR